MSSHESVSREVPHDSTFAAQIVEYVQSNELLADPVTRRDYFEHLDSDDFIDMTQQVASLVRTGDSNQRQHFDGAGIMLVLHEVPEQRHKEGLLRETWDTARSFLTDRTISDENALEYAALTVAGGLLFTHPFDDGNGRTSRILSYVMTRGAEVDEASVGSLLESGSKAWEVTPSDRTVTSYWLDEPFGGEQPNEITWNSHVSAHQVTKFGDVANAISSSRYKSLTIRKFIETADEAVDQLVEACVVRSEDGDMVSLDADRLIELVTNDPERGIGHAHQLMDIKSNYEAQYVRTYLAAMRSDVYDTARVISERERTPPVEHVYKGKIEETAQFYAHLNERALARYAAISAVLGERAVNGQYLLRDEAVAAHRGYSTYYQ